MGTALTAIALARAPVSPRRASAVRAPWGSVERAGVWLPLGLILLAAVAIRYPNYANPAVDFDETFYLLTGDRMLGGALPFVDIWDRKPVGLFLIYAAIRTLGGTGIAEYQVMATLFAAATGWVIYATSRRWTGRWAAVAAAVVYLLHMRLFMSAAGQSETFFNLFLAGAGWLAMRANDTEDRPRIFQLGCGATLLLGLAIQIKYMIVPQCLFFGGFFLWRLHAAGSPLATIVTRALFFALIGLAPTVAAASYYASVGELDAFVQANFLSIFSRGALDAKALNYTALYVIAGSAPIVVCAAVTLVKGLRRRDPVPTRDVALLAGWFVASLVGFFMIGNIYIHYFAPALVPLCLLAAPLMRRLAPGAMIFILLANWAGQLSAYPNLGVTDRNRKGMAAITRAVAPHIGTRCLYVYDGPSSAYLLTHSCLPTRFVYPDHLNNAMEADALGIDTVAEVRRILETRPGAILIANRPVVPLWNPGTLRLVREALARDYIRIAAVPVEDRVIAVYALRPAATARAHANADPAAPSQAPGS